jgi:hypothetical protein
VHHFQVFNVFINLNGMSYLQAKEQNSVHCASVCPWFSMGSNQP